MPTDVSKIPDAPRSAQDLKTWGKWLLPVFIFVVAIGLIVPFGLATSGKARGWINKLVSGDAKDGPLSVAPGGALLTGGGG